MAIRTLKVNASASDVAIYEFDLHSNDNAKIAITADLSLVSYSGLFLINLFVLDGDVRLHVDNSTNTYVGNLISSIRVATLSGYPSNRGFILVTFTQPARINVKQLQGQGMVVFYSSPTVSSTINAKIVYTQSQNFIDDYYLFKTDYNSNEVYMKNTEDYLEVMVGSPMRVLNDSATGSNTDYGMILKSLLVGSPSYWLTIDNSPTAHPVKINIPDEDIGIVFSGDSEGQYAPVIAAWDADANDYTGAIRFDYGDLILIANTSIELYASNPGLHHNASDLFVELRYTGDIFLKKPTHIESALDVSSDVSIGNILLVASDASIGGNLTVNGSLSVSGTKNAVVPSRKDPKDKSLRIPCAALESPFASGVYTILSVKVDDIVNGKQNKTVIDIPDVFTNAVAMKTVKAFIQFKGAQPIYLDYDITKEKGQYKLVIEYEFFGIANHTSIDIFLWGRRWDNKLKEDIEFKMYS